MGPSYSSIVVDRGHIFIPPKSPDSEIYRMCVASFDCRNIHRFPQRHVVHAAKAWLYDLLVFISFEISLSLLRSDVRLPFFLHSHRHGHRYRVPRHLESSQSRWPRFWTYSSAPCWS